MSRHKLKRSAYKRKTVRKRVFKSQHFKIMSRHKTKLKGEKSVATKKFYVTTFFKSNKVFMS